MKNKDSTEGLSIDKIMHFLVHNSFLFTVAIMCLVHVTLLVIMLVANVPRLVSFNILSVIVYVFCMVLCKTGQMLPVYISILLEVASYSIVSVIYIGWKCGGSFFLFSIVPIIIYFGCFIFTGKKRLLIVLFLVLDFATYVALYVGFINVTPIIEVPQTISMVLTIFTSFVMVFATIFYNVIYIYSSEGELVSLEQKNEKLSADAQEDALTSLLNRRGFLPLVKTLMDEKHSHYFCVAFCDIDNFKRVNDSYGHECGDEVLRHIARLIKKEMYGCEICRWGGEEMVILMRDYDFAVAKSKMEYIRKCVETTPTVFFNKYISVTITIGVEEYKDIYHEPDEIIKVADRRMYYGKQHGKNIVISSDEED